jgi:glycosyltransferase involved in cell wall biosynthesis
MLATVYRHALRSWDHAAAQRPDQMVAISQTASARIEKYYRRSSLVIPPPSRSVTTGTSGLVPEGEYYLIVARLVPHKTLSVVMDAFAKLRYRLVIVGDGPLRTTLAGRAGNNISFTGWVSDDELDGLYEHCRAVIIPNEEDWGLTAIEAMAHGKPVLALRKGGAMETVVEGVTGEFFDDPIPEALADGMKRIRAATSGYDTERIRAHALQYGEEQFSTRMRTLIEQGQ